MNPPSYPNPTDTANTQSSLNTKTATTQQQLGMVDQTNPFGSQTFSQSGTWPDGTPKYTGNTTFSGPVQGIVDQNLTAASKPLDLSNSATESRLMELGRSRLDPILAQRRESTNQQLFNTGARPGSEAYKRAESAVTQGENDAYNELLLNGHGQAFNEAITARNQPLNELNAIRSGTQIQSPQYSPAGVSPVDYTGQVANQYGAQQKQYNDTWSGIGNLAGAVGGWAFSDERLKENIHATGEKTPDGIPVKSFRYKGSPLMEVGVVAQDVEKRRPDAVRKVGGVREVNYPAIGMMGLGAKRAA